MTKPIYIERGEWKGVPYGGELYATEEYLGLSPIRQISAVCFLNKENIVLFKHIDGFFGLPGGSLEPGEDIKQALTREVYEEAALKLIDFGVVGYIKAYPLAEPEKVGYQLRCWAKVELLEEQVNDPDGKAIDREIVAIDQAIEFLGWGRKGKLIINLALEKYNEHKS